MAAPESTPLPYVVPGDLVSTRADALRQSLLPLAEAGKGDAPLEIDLRAARLIDSVGLNLLVTAIKARKRHGGSVRLLVAHPSVLRVLQFTRLDQHAEIIAP